MKNMFVYVTINRPDTWEGLQKEFQKTKTDIDVVSEMDVSPCAKLLVSVELNAQLEKIKERMHKFVDTLS